MDKVINTFYLGENQGFGFGPWNTTKPDYQKILSQFTYPSIKNNSIDRFFDKTTGKPRPPHSDYIPERDKLPDIKNYQPVDFTRTNAQPLKPLTQEMFRHFDNYGFLHTQPKNVPNENFTPYLIRMQMLEEKAKRLEYKNKTDLENNLKMIKDKYIGNGRFKKFLDDHQEEIMNGQFPINTAQSQQLPQINNNQNNILPMYPGQMNNPYNNPMNNPNPYAYTSENTNMETAEETDGNTKKKRKKKKRKKKTKEQKHTIDSNESGSPFLSHGSNLFASPKFKTRRRSTLMDPSVGSVVNGLANSTKRSSVISPGNNIFPINPTVTSRNSGPRRRNDLVTQSQILQLREMIPEYPLSDVALQLQDQGAKVDEMVNGLNELLTEMKTKISDKLDKMLNTGIGKYEIYKNVIASGGTKKLQDAYRKLIDKEDIEIGEEEDIERDKEYEHQVYELLDKKLEEYNTYRDEDDIRRRIEEERNDIEKEKEKRAKELEALEKRKIRISCLPSIAYEGKKPKKSKSKKKKNKSKKRGKKRRVSLRKSPKRGEKDEEEQKKEEEDVKENNEEEKKNDVVNLVPVKKDEEEKENASKKKKKKKKDKKSNFHFF